MKIVIVDSYVETVGTGIVGKEITDVEYEAILAAIERKPKAEPGYQYRLRADTLEWILVELPPAPEDEDISPEEAMEILMGGGGE